MASLEEVAYDLSRQALADQASVVDALRGRTGPLVAATVAVAGLLAKPAVADAPAFRLGIAIVGFIAGIVALVAAVNVLRSRPLGFAVDSAGLYEVAKPDRQHPEVYYVALAGTLRETRLKNEPGVAKMHSWYGVALGALVLEALALALAVAIS